MVNFNGDYQICKGSLQYKTHRRHLTPRCLQWSAAGGVVKSVGMRSAYAFVRYSSAHHFLSNFTTDCAPVGGKSFSVSLIPVFRCIFWRVLEDFTRLSLFELQHCTCARFLKGGSVVAVVKGLLIASFLSFVGFVPRCFLCDSSQDSFSRVRVDRYVRRSLSRWR